ncbi:hypothetical protein M408DRAFT_303367 [Serendipita vermifera MAFF 305830]|uniref:tRNA (cytosine(38)-C(5))-methyltransferase n=1 Tax=Serendipita vermifera MAFF 305830 TaxID=933852 RepID=A0A0C2XZG9_SERVB|nr:hypothetical protein M408DRAFT_303367 [Serendipita vermifera MAFF 305830]
MPPIRAIEFYSGIGGLHEALKRASVQSRVVAAFEWDPSAAAVYEYNYGKGIVHKKDISKLQPEDLEIFGANTWLASPSCQPYTVLGLGKGAADPRAASFLHLMNVVLEAMVERQTNPEYILVENVAGFETSDTRTDVLGLLHRLGYHTMEFLLTPRQCGIPNSRLRYYLVARRSSFEEVEQTTTIFNHIPGKMEQEENSSFVGLISEYLDEGVDQATVIPDRVLERWGRLFDIVKPSSNNTCCFTRGYTHFIEGTGSILQGSESLEQGVSDAVSHLHQLELRYFSPEELLRLFSISTRDRKLVWPNFITQKTKYRLIGNSINVAVVCRVIEFLCS